MKCKDCEHYVSFNGKMVCDKPTLDYGDCPFETESNNECEFGSLKDFQNISIGR